MISQITVVQNIQVRTTMLTLLSRMKIISGWGYAGSSKQSGKLSKNLPFFDRQNEHTPTPTSTSG